MKKITFLIALLALSLGFSQEIVVNGDFESGASPWTGNGAGVNVVDDGSGNFVNSALVGAAAESWQTSLQQVVTLTQGETYQMTFDAYVDSGTATMIAGIGQNGGGFLNSSQTPTVTTTPTNFDYTFTANWDTVANQARVFFDMGGTGNSGITISIDNVSLQVFTLDPATDASLSALEVDSSPVPGFSSETLDYTIAYPPGTVTVPTITTATATEEGIGATVSITDAITIPGSATIEVTASDMMTIQTYTVNYTIEGPATAAPNPPVRDAADVFSVFSGGIYNDVAPIEGTEAFGGDGYDNFSVESPDDTRRITFAAPGDGMQFLYITNGIDLTDFTHMHMDVYIEGPVDDGQVFTYNLINQPPGQGAVSINTNVTTNDIGSGAWYAVDVALDSFNGSPMTRDFVTLLQLIGAGPSVYGPLYFDNFYFYKLNDSCAEATAIPLDGSTLEISNVGATDSGQTASCDPMGVISDVWYSVVADSDEFYLETTAPNISIFSGSCGSLTEVACNPGNNVAVTGITSGNTYYVRVTDDGTARAPGPFTLKISGASLSNTDFNANQFKVYPNPTNNNWNIEGSNTVIDTVEVFDILGKRVQTINPNSQQATLDASGLKTGIYLAKIYAGNAVKTIKLIKN